MTTDHDMPRGITIEAGSAESGIFGLAVSGDVIMSSVCGCYLRGVARNLDKARSMLRREAMHYLTSEMGFCELAAHNIFLRLHEGLSTTEARH